MEGAYEPRKYRELFSAPDVIYFRCSVGETDLQVGIGLSEVSSSGELAKNRHAVDLLRDRVTRTILRARGEIESYIPTHPEFFTSLVPVIPRPWAPPIARWMCASAARAKVGPMAAVAGAIGQTVGVDLMSAGALFNGDQVRIGDVIVENGGDIFIVSSRVRRVGIYAGESPLSGKVALEIAPRQMPCGVCTSSGTVGHSRSFGRCDAAVVVAGDTALADAVATRVANEVRSREDIEDALDIASKISGVTGAVVVIGDALGAIGDIKLASA
ncbi:MAG: UPF0280 family protein [Bacillota bacterium]|jgi:ApbE superfamily uncharacterized protein (UPF0280 family)